MDQPKRIPLDACLHAHALQGSPVAPYPFVPHGVTYEPATHGPAHQVSWPTPGECDDLIRDVADKIAAAGSHRVQDLK